ARYCYSVCLRHLCMLHWHGLPTTFEAVAELGPGDSLGVGLAMLLCGAGRYIALDAIRYADNASNFPVLEDLIRPFRERAAIPDQTEFPLAQPSLHSYAFPADFLTQARIDAALNPTRIDAIRTAVANPGVSLRDGGRVSYCAPWAAGMIERATVDFV